MPHSTLRLSSSVGTNGKNDASDVKLIQSLLNCHLRSKKSTDSIAIDGKISPLLLEKIEEFQKEKIKDENQSRTINKGDSTFKALINDLNKSFVPVNIPLPKRGILTWDAEGTEGGRYHSRRLHVPSTSSGLTVGRGYDCKNREPGQIQAELSKCGLPPRVRQPN